MTIKLTYNSVNYDAEIVAGDADIDMDHAMVGETLTVDTLTVRVITSTSPTFIKNGAGLFYVDTTMIGKYYLFEMHQTAPEEYEFYFCSAIRLLDMTRHKGGLYTGQTAGDIIDEIIESIVAYSVDPTVEDIQVYGYLPYASRRNNLQMLLMAVGAAVKNASDGSLLFTELTDTTAGVFDENRVFIGGSVIDKNPATAVQVTEHNFLESAEEVTLFDDSTISTETVIFNEPFHDLSITGGTITASGVNYCTFSASGAVVLTGQRYTHVTRIITEGTAPTGSGDDVVRSVTGNTLLTPNNAVDVAEKLFDYLSVAQSIKQEVIFGTERPADVVSVIHPFSRSLVDACLKSMQISFGKTENRAVCEFLVGYVPPGVTTGFQNFVVLTGSGTWTVPAGVTKIRAILAGPGQGGQGGQGGSAPANYGVYANGGTAGIAGQSGKIFEINMVVTPAQGIGYVAPTGSAGGAGSSGMPAGSGSTPAPIGSLASVPAPTTFGGLSSEQGRSYPYGYSEPKSGIVCAMSAIDGANGGQGTGVSDPSSSVTFGEQTWTGGNNIVYALGGGAAVGSNGGDAYLYQSYYYRGGLGASAVPGTDAAHYGEGGSGGHGGGGGGAAASADNRGWVGSGGNGSSGGDGGSGVIVIYY